MRWKRSFSLELGEPCILFPPGFLYPFNRHLLSICCILCLVSSGGTAVWEIEVVPALLWLPVAPSQTALTSVAVNDSSLLSLPVMGVAGLGLVDLTWGPSYSCSLMVVGA